LIVDAATTQRPGLGEPSAYDTVVVFGVAVLDATHIAILPLPESPCAVYPSSVTDPCPDAGAAVAANPLNKAITALPAGPAGPIAPGAPPAVTTCGDEMVAAGAALPVAPVFVSVAPVEVEIVVTV
jgi:hypothetical protein